MNSSCSDCTDGLHCVCRRMHACHIEHYVHFQLCVCVYISVCLVPGVPSPAFVISPSADCDMEAPLISFTQLFTGFRLSHFSVYDSLLSPFLPSLSSTSPSPLPLLPSSRSLRLSRCLPNTPTASSSSLLPPSSLTPAHACLCLRSSE